MAASNYFARWNAALAEACRLTPELKKPQTWLGLMSGTSLDGVDAVLASFEIDKTGTLLWQVEANHSIPFPKDLKNQLLELQASQTITLKNLCTLEVELARLYAEVSQPILTQYPVTGIACHGQTVSHQASQNKECGLTLQLVNSAELAELTKTPVISDFRRADIAAGGQGAPLVCLADLLLFSHQTSGRCLQNIGGIGNVTALPGLCTGQDPLSFDTGPGNMLMDLAMMSFFEEPYDRDGLKSAAGKINPQLVETLLDHPFCQQFPPKSTGRDDFGQAYFEHLRAQFSTLAANDWLASLCEATAQTIVQSYERWILPYTSIQEAYIAGGGAYNPTLMRRLKELLALKDIRLFPQDVLGLPAQEKEAFAFALLGWTHWNGLPGNVPSCTGAQRPVGLGQVSQPYSTLFDVGGRS